MKFVPSLDLSISLSATPFTWAIQRLSIYLFTGIAIATTFIICLGAYVAIMPLVRPAKMVPAAGAYPPLLMREIQSITPDKPRPEINSDAQPMARLLTIPQSDTAAPTSGPGTAAVPAKQETRLTERPHLKKKPERTEVATAKPTVGPTNNYSQTEEKKKTNERRDDAFLTTIDGKQRLLAASEIVNSNILDQDNKPIGRVASIVMDAHGQLLAKVSLERTPPTVSNGVGLLGTMIGIASVGTQNTEATIPLSTLEWQLAPGGLIAKTSRDKLNLISPNDLTRR